MKQYKIYGGLSGESDLYHGLYWFSSDAEAENFAYALAFEEYESYGGNHGLLDRNAIKEELIDAGWIDPNVNTEQHINSLVEAMYVEQVESNIEWRAVPVVRTGAVDYADTTDADWSDGSDDADCYCE